MSSWKCRNTIWMLVLILVFIALMVNGRRKKTKNKRKLSALKADSMTDDSRDLRNFVLVEGDIFLGTLMQIHSGGRGGICRNLSHSALIELEALLYAVDMVNIHISLLPGIKLGVYVRDSCADPDHALKQALTIMEGRYSESPRWSYRCPDGNVAQSVLPQITGLITSIESPAANVQAASLLQLFRLPQINAKSRSPLLRTIGRFPYLHHSVPSYFQQLSVVMEVLRYFHWTYIHVIFEDSEYGSMLSYKLQEILQHNGICIANTIMMSTMFSKGRKQMFDMIAARLVEHRYARGVVIVTENSRTVPQLLAAVKRVGGTRRLAFFGLGCGRNIKTENIQEELEGTLVLQLISSKVASLKEHITQLTPMKNERNPWFIEFWEEVFHCKMPINKNYANQTLLNVTHGTWGDGKRRSCTGNEDLNQYIKSLGEDTEHITNAVMAFAQTLHDIHWEYCHGKPGLCDTIKQMTGEQLSRYLEKVRFKTLSGQEFEFHSQREPKSFYRLWNYQQTNPGVWKWVNLGVSKHHFKNSTLALVKFRLREANFPPSFCSLPCEPGEMKSQFKDSCCWICIPCPPGHYLPEETRCDICPIGTEPNFDRRSCVPTLRKPASASERRKPTNSSAEKVKAEAPKRKYQNKLSSRMKPNGSASSNGKKKRWQLFKKNPSGKSSKQLNGTIEDQNEINGTLEWETFGKPAIDTNSTLTREKEKDLDQSEVSVSDKQPAEGNSKIKSMKTNKENPKEKKESDSIEIKQEQEMVNTKKNDSQHDILNLPKDDSENKAATQNSLLQQSTTKSRNSLKTEPSRSNTISKIPGSQRKKKSTPEFHFGITSPKVFSSSEESTETSQPSLAVNSTDKNVKEKF